MCDSEARCKSRAHTRPGALLRRHQEHFSKGGRKDGVQDRKMRQEHKRLGGRSKVSRPMGPKQMEGFVGSNDL